MQSEVQKIRKIAQKIQSGSASFSELYSYLDSLTYQHESDSDEELDMQKYIRPVRKMLSTYKRSIKTVKEHSDVIEEVLMERQGAKENNSYLQNAKTKTKKRISSKELQTVTMEELDEEIGELERKIRKMR